MGNSERFDIGSVGVEGGLFNLVGIGLMLV